MRFITVGYCLCSSSCFYFIGFWGGGFLNSKNGLGIVVFFLILLPGRRISARWVFPDPSAEDTMPPRLSSKAVPVPALSSPKIAPQSWSKRRGHDRL